jgi:hypothetical protein
MPRALPPVTSVWPHVRDARVVYARTALLPAPDDPTLAGEELSLTARQRTRVTDPFSSTAVPDVIEEYLEHGVAQCLAFNRRGGLLAGEAPIPSGEDSVGPIPRDPKTSASTASYPFMPRPLSQAGGHWGGIQTREQGTWGRCVAPHAWAACCSTHRSPFSATQSRYVRWNLESALRVPATQVSRQWRLPQWPAIWNLCSSTLRIRPHT